MKKNIIILSICITICLISIVSKKVFDNKSNLVSNDAIAYYLDGEEVSQIPPKGKYDVTVTCDRGATAIWNEDTWSITIYNATKIGTRCSVSFVTNNNYKDGRYESTGSCISSGCEIWINNNSNFTTGCAGSSVSASSASSCNQ